MVRARGLGNRHHMMAFVALAALSLVSLRQCVSMDAHAQGPTDGTRSTLPAGYHFGTVRYVTDGDTINVQVAKSQWIAPHGRLSIRISGIDSPEKARVNAKCDREFELGKTATEYAKSLMPVGSIVRFYPSATRDKYSRVDARVLLPDGRDVGQLMMAGGYAKPWSGRGPKPNWCT